MANGKFDPEIKCAICLLTLNAESTIGALIESIKSQTLKLFKILVIDSSSTDNTIKNVHESGAHLINISRESFNHGATRKSATKICSEADIIIFMTQDVLLAASDALEKLVSVFANPGIGIAFGRQLPHRGAGPIESHARLFNYPSESRVKSVADIPLLGIKSVFISNSFSAYRRSALEAVGGFPSDCIVSEDTFVAAKMLFAGWQIAYCAEAKVFHSHNYNYFQEFQRYFDIGVFHAREPWVRQQLGGAEGEGRRFIFSELNFLLRKSPHLVFSACIRSAVKYLGFRSGLVEKFLPIGLKRKLSMQKSFWRIPNMESSDA